MNVANIPAARRFSRAFVYESGGIQTDHTGRRRSHARLCDMTSGNRPIMSIDITDHGN